MYSKRPPAQAAFEWSRRRVEQFSTTHNRPLPHFPAFILSCTEALQGLVCDRAEFVLHRVSITPRFQHDTVRPSGVHRVCCAGVVVLSASAEVGPDDERSGTPVRAQACALGRKRACAVSPQRCHLRRLSVVRAASGPRHIAMDTVRTRSEFPVRAPVALMRWVPTTDSCAELDGVVDAAPDCTGISAPPRYHEDASPETLK
jgi:hypothetical protein